MSLKTLNEKSKEFELPEEVIDKRETGRVSFIEKFPINSIKNLTLDQYVQGTDKNSFCYWLEFKEILFGIGGGNASKFGLYKSDDGNYYTSFGKNKKLLSGTELEAHFTKIKTVIESALEYTEQDKIDKIKDLDIPVWNMILLKILSLYYPEKFITVGASDVLIECARDITIKNIDLSPQNLIQINYECKKALTVLTEYKDWPYEKIGSFIWETYYGDAKRSYYILGSKYGEKSDEDIFPEMYQRLVISVGFAPKTDLSEYYCKNHSEIVKFLKEQGEESKSYTALKLFLNLKKGDRVAIKADGSPKGSKGFLSIVGIAEILEKDGKIYNHDPNGLGHIVNVKFIKAPVYKEFEMGGYGRTMHKIKKTEHIDLLFKSEYKPSVLKSAKKEFKNGNEIKNMEEPLNQILYGPPGTGKTYHTINKAIEIIDPDFNFNQDRKLIKERYDKYVKEGRIVFTTFHQSMSYEDFIEGIKPIAPETEGQPIKYKVIGGIFKNICNEARKADYKIAKLNGDVHELTPELFADFYKSLADNLPSKDSNNSDFRLKTPTGYDFELYKNSANTIVVKAGDKITPMSLSLFELTRVFFEKNTPNLKSYTNPTIQHILKNVEIESIDVDNSKKPFVLIIDEINRGNVSSIFGELITLIEEDKRIGANEELRVVLPYSKDNEDKFGVPPNLHIIGTMNTADRSVEALDTALRRRFVFKEMLPQTELLSPSAMYCRLLWEYKDVEWSNIEYVEKENMLFDFLGVEKALEENKKDIWEDMKDEEITEKTSYFDQFNFNGYNLQRILDIINNRIEILLDKDHLIGHSYFMNVSNEIELKKAFSKQIIPLLQEYFFGDYGKIALVLGEGFCKGKKVNSAAVIFAKVDDYETGSFDEKIIYNIENVDREDFDIKNAIKILLENCQNNNE